MREGGPKRSDNYFGLARATRLYQARVLSAQSLWKKAVYAKAGDYDLNHGHRGPPFDFSWSEQIEWALSQSPASPQGKESRS